MVGISNTRDLIQGIVYKDEGRAERAKGRKGNIHRKLLMLLGWHA